MDSTLECDAELTTPEANSPEPGLSSDVMEWVGSVLDHDAGGQSPGLLTSAAMLPIPGAVTGVDSVLEASAGRPPPELVARVGMLSERGSATDDMAGVDSSVMVIIATKL